ncbi:HFL173Cp [Eremothecium sinecaudum]|uniref:Large ribosomal subunit protein uL23m n=1 Tax=Eremothecium sinecaudum TaxID=45286 RepID=A0A0X8HUK9_9SACH|nr:HFL173Cp [Eremothecium sinecaudum]AMD21683.1 HFL173Cp [Eremothecium sinecaudum]
MPGLDFISRFPVRALSTVAEGAQKAIIGGRVKSTVQQRILESTEKAFEEGKPHFKVGGTKHYFPKARIILLRPNAKHTPYQAKFIVPKSFNKLDLRDYLYHVYGLRALNVTSQLLHGKYVYSGPNTSRYREPQIKKMTIDMAEPFIWPEEPEDTSAWMVDFEKELGKYNNEAHALGSDAFKPGTAFGGALGPYKEVAQPFIPKMMKRRALNSKRKMEESIERLEKLQKINNYVC